MAAKQINLSFFFSFFGICYPLLPDLPPPPNKNKNNGLTVRKTSRTIPPNVTDIISKTDNDTLIHRLCACISSILEIKIIILLLFKSQKC